MTCDVCGKNIPRGKRYKSDRYQAKHFCSEECYNRFLKIKSQPKSRVNFKPDKTHPRRKFTDYLQEWTGDRVNWEAIMKQAKDITEEHGLSWEEMYLVLKYARVYEQVEWDFQYGLGQIFPRYIQPCMEFIESINKAKQAEVPEVNIVKIKRGKSVKKVNW